MKKQTKHSINAQTLRSALYLLLLVAVCAIPFALAQRNGVKRTIQQGTQFQKPQMLVPNAPALGQSQSLASPETISSWTIVAPYPAAIEAPCVGTDGTAAYSGAGYAGGASSGFYRTTDDGMSWTPLASVPTALYATRGVFAPNVNKFYI